MAINKKLIHFNKKSDFESEVAKGNILNYSICFIADTKEIYTHGNYYSQVSEAPIDGLKYIRVDGAWYVLSTSSSSTDGLMSSSDKTKLDGIESGAQKNTVTGIKVGSTQYDPDSDCIISLPEFPTATKIEWDNILNKPSSFTPSAHTHAISEITNLQATLDGKAAASHTHAIADITNISSASVSYASSAGNADTLDGNHASAFATAGHTHSYIPTSASCNKNWAWSGQSGQPSWLWGSNDGSNCYVWNPSNFSVNYASSAGNADTLDGNHASAFAAASHSHSYLPLSGGTMTGNINLSNTNAKLAFGTLTTSPITGYKAPNLSSPGVGLYSRYSGSSDEGAIIITEDTCVIYNSADTGWNFQVMDKDLGTDLTNDATRSFGVNQNHQAWSLAGFVKSGSSDSYVLLGGGGHKAESSLSVSYASSAGNADTVDGKHASAFAAASHSHDYIPTSASCNKNWVFAGQGGQPLWLWGSNDGSNCLVWNPSNFNVSYASSAGNADTLDGNHASAFLLLSGGTMNSDARISHADGDLYLGRADNKGWLACQDMCSQNALGDTYWSLRAEGRFNARSISQTSDLRKKNVLSNEVLSVKEIAAAPLFRYTFKSDDNQYIHVGTSAQYWSGIHEDWFTLKDDEGYYQMELQNLGVAMGISLAREIVEYKSKTDKKIEDLLNQINVLEKANESLEARVKELEGRMTA